MLGSRGWRWTGLGAVGAAALLAAGCTLESGERVYSARAGFANDDSGLYLVLSSHDERPGSMGDVITDHYAYELRVAALDGTMQRTVLERSGRGVRSVYYQASAGYLLVISDEGDQSLGWRADVVRLDGQVDALERGNIAKPVFLPDPTGALIARVRTTCEPELCSSWQARSVQYVSFYDSATLERVGALHAVEWPPHEETGGASGSVLTWSLDGRLVVSRGAEALALAPDGGREAVPVPSCSGIVTAGPVASDGRRAEATWDGEHARVSITRGEMPGWPTRCFGEDG